MRQQLETERAQREQREAAWEAERAAATAAAEEAQREHTVLVATAAECNEKLQVRVLLLLSLSTQHPFADAGKQATASSLSLSLTHPPHCACCRAVLLRLDFCEACVYPGLKRLDLKPRPDIL